MGSLAKRMGRMSTPEKLAEMVIEMTETIDDLRGEKSSLIERSRIAQTKANNDLDRVSKVMVEDLDRYRVAIQSMYDAMDMRGDVDAFDFPYPSRVASALIEVIKSKGSVDPSRSLRRAEDHATQCHKERDEAVKSMVGLSAELESVRSKARSQVDQIDSLRREILSLEADVKSARSDTQALRVETWQVIEERDKASTALMVANEAIAELERDRRREVIVID